MTHPLPAGGEGELGVSSHRPLRTGKVLVEDTHAFYFCCSLTGSTCLSHQQVISFSVFLCVGNDGGGGGGGAYDRAPASTPSTPIRGSINIQLSYYINW